MKPSKRRRKVYEELYNEDNFIEDDENDKEIFEGIAKGCAKGWFIK